MWIRVEGSQSKNHEDNIAGKGMNSLSHYNLVQIFLLAEALIIPVVKAGETIGKIGENTGMAGDESQKQK